MTIDELISKYYDSFSNSDVDIAKYILNNKKTVSQMSIDSLAATCLVSRSTVMRFSQKLGLKGFAELKLLIKMNLQTIPNYPGNFVELICKNEMSVIKHFQNTDMTAVCELLFQANRIFVYGTGQVQRSVAAEFKRLFLYLGIVVDVISGEGEFRQTNRIIGDQDVIFAISKDGEGAFLKEMLQELQMKDVPIISLTRSSNNTVAQLSTQNIFVSIERHALVDNFFFDTMQSMYLAVEILFSKYVEYIRGMELEHN